MGQRTICCVPCCRGVRYRITLMFEITALGAILPSYDVETRILDKGQYGSIETFAKIALALVIFFCLLEGVVVASIGPALYFADVWNVMDWTNFIIYFMVYAQIMYTQWAISRSHGPNLDCSHYLCAEVGYFDDWRVMVSFRKAKMFLSLCLCIQLFKILKFAAQLVPKMGLATAVLRKCAVDLLFFGITFVISMLAFSMMLYVQLGPFMEGYWDQIPAFISLFRALFGDFDIDEIMNNSSGYLNAILFLGYLFVAIFIMLSMFLAILAEAQVAVREDEETLKAEDSEFNEYGVLASAASRWRRCTQPLVERFVPKKDEAVEDDDDHVGQSRSTNTGSHHHKKVENDELLKVLLAMQQDIAELKAGAVDKAVFEEISQRIDNVAPLISVAVESANPLSA